MPHDPLSDIAHVIQLSVAPVFLLTALGTFLSVLGNRLGRIVDRARHIADRLPTMSEQAHRAALSEITFLVRRRRLVNFAITSGTTAALFVCVLIASAFVGTMVHVDVTVPMAVLFVLAMLAFICALVAFLVEVLVAVANVRIAVEEAERARPHAG